MDIVPEIVIYMKFAKFGYKIDGLWELLNECDLEMTWYTDDLMFEWFVCLWCALQLYLHPLYFFEVIV